MTKFSYWWMKCEYISPERKNERSLLLLHRDYLIMISNENTRWVTVAGKSKTAQQWENFWICVQFWISVLLSISYSGLNKKPVLREPENISRWSLLFLVENQKFSNPWASAGLYFHSSSSYYRKTEKRARIHCGRRQPV